ncbi:MAG: iron chelate uptake ABC transporter family permease subunit, partial [Pseudomonadota bacterium]
MLDRRLTWLAILTLVCAILFMTLEARGKWSFVLPFRGAKLLALLLVAVAVSTSTLLFQTITRNRILTPSIMGFDALYLLILTAAVFILGAQSYVQVPELVQFLINLTLLTVGALALYGTLMRDVRQDLMRMILTGVIFAVLFRSVASFMIRIIDPNEFSVIQVNAYARFNRIETDLLSIAVLLCGIALAVAWRMRYRLDVLALGHDAAINLGENPKRARLQVLILISTLVATSTALVGPVVFLGLLVVNLAYLVTPTTRHAILLPS